MKQINFTLIGDGSSDKILVTIIKWLLNDLYPTVPNEGEFADFSSFKNPPKASEVAERIKLAQHYYCCDILIYHRDGESVTDIKKTIQQRKNEIINSQGIENTNNIVVIVPVKMMETWLLINENAIKKAADNPNYSKPISLPKITELEKQKQPKAYLHELLISCSELTGRKIKNFNPHKRTHLVAEYIEDYNALRQLTAFQEFENDLKIVLQNL